MTTEKVIKLLAEHLDISESEITENTTFDDLGVDSLDVVEIIMELEDEFGISINPDEAGTSIKQLAAYIDAQ